MFPWIVPDIFNMRNQADDGRNLWLQISTNFINAFGQEILTSRVIVILYRKLFRKTLKYFMKELRIMLHCFFYEVKHFFNYCYTVSRTIVLKGFFFFFA